MSKRAKLKHPYKKIRSKWIRRTNVRFSVYENQEGVIHCYVGDEEAPRVMCDGTMIDLFIWIGRYLSEKRKLPRHINLGSIAVGAARTNTEIRTMIAIETYDTAASSGLELLS